ncbi:MAG: hypothetical protein ACOVSR_09745 [Bacteroidia bacterium]
MDNYKFTKGKWSFSDYGSCFAIETKLDNGQEHSVFTDQFCHASKFNGDAKANALLISKAPEMLEMLKELHETLKDFDGWREEFNKIENLIKEATEI